MQRLLSVSTSTMQASPAPDTAEHVDATSVPDSDAVNATSVPDAAAEAIDRAPSGGIQFGGQAATTRTIARKPIGPRGIRPLVVSFLRVQRGSTRAPRGRRVRSTASRDGPLPSTDDDRPHDVAGLPRRKAAA